MIGKQDREIPQTVKSISHRKPLPGNSVGEHCQVVAGSQGISRYVFSPNPASKHRPTEQTVGAACQHRPAPFGVGPGKRHHPVPVHAFNCVKPGLRHQKFDAEVAVRLMLGEFLFRNGVEVGFVLENGFSADTGALGNNNRLFGRQSTLFVRGSFGEIAFGRMGQLTSGNGSYGLTGNLSPFGTSWGGSVEGSTYMVGYNRMDNTVVYKTPTFGGFTVYAQYSSDMNTLVQDTTENKGNSNRYYALGATFNAGALNLVGTVDSYNWDSSNGKMEQLDDGLTVTLGGSYDFGVAKAYLGAQYFDNMLAGTGAAATKTLDGYGFASAWSALQQAKGFGAMAGVGAPVAGGTAMFAVGYAKAEEATDNAATKDYEVTRLGVSAGYNYALSKRTDVYAVAAYYQDDQDTGTTSTKPTTTNVFVGMRHTF